MSGLITGLYDWQKNSYINYPGLISTVLYFAGCNLGCPYCHNPEIVTGKSRGDTLSEPVWKFLHHRKSLIDGIVLTGGEPTLYRDLKGIIPQLKKIGYKIKLDTNGLLPDAINNFEPDYIALDIKGLPSDYSTVLGCNYEKIQERLEKSVSIVKSYKKNGEIRISLFPMTVNENSIDKIGSLIEGISVVYLQKLQQNTPLLDNSSSDSFDISQESIIAIQNALSRYVDKCIIRDQ